MKGSVYKRVGKDGAVRWACSFTTGSRSNGSRRTHQRGGYERKKDAEAALGEAVHAWGKGDQRPTMKPVAKPTGQYLKEWLVGLPLERAATRRPT